MERGSKEITRWYPPDGNASMGGEGVAGSAEGWNSGMSASACRCGCRKMGTYVFRTEYMVSFGDG